MWISVELLAPWIRLLILLVEQQIAFALSLMR